MVNPWLIHGVTIRVFQVHRTAGRQLIACGFRGKQAAMVKQRWIHGVMIMG